VRLLAIFAHPDDEVGTAGTLAKHAHRGDAVKLVWLTRGELASQFGTMAPEEVAAIREGHGREVAQIVGGEYEFLNYPDAGLTGGRDEALAVAKLIAAWKPDVVFTWDYQDVHPDHRATYWAVFSALKLCRIPKLVGEPHRKPVRLLHYHRNDISRPSVYVDISKSLEVAEKVFLLYHDFYKWEFTLENYRANRARLGGEAGVKYAERFQSETPVALSFLPSGKSGEIEE
jgi:LmbE family N-acetylglucosaminyl deacetylase